MARPLPKAEGVTALEIDNCGVASEAGYSAHRRRGETPCAGCRVAATEARRDRKYKLQPGQWAALYTEQGGRCRICGALPNHHPLVVDHSHVDGTVRGLLCRFCNLTLGTALDSPEILRRAQIYLEAGLKAAPDEFLGDLRRKGVRAKLWKSSQKRRAVDAA